MPTIVVQGDEGDTANANSYNSVDEFTSYSSDHGFAITDYTEDEVEIALIKATEFLDNRFPFNGYPANDYDIQLTQFPRNQIYGQRGEAVEGIPREVKSAHNEYAFRALSEPLFSDVTLSSSNIQSVTNTVDVISTSTTYFRPTEIGQDNIFKKPDQILLRSGFVDDPNQVLLG